MDVVSTFLPVLEISVIVPTFSPGDYVRDCVLCLDRQSLDHSLFEVVFILNGQKEPYGTFLEEILRETGLNYQIIHTPQVGVSHARNLGLEQARGSYVAFIDDDDMVSERYLESLRAVTTESVVGVSGFRAFRDDAPSEDAPFFLCRKKIKPHKYATWPFYRCRSVLSVSVGKLAHRNVIMDRRFDERFSLGEDSLFYTSLTDRIDHLCYAGDGAVYSVRLRDGSATHKPYSSSYIISNAFRLMAAYWKVYWRNPRGYSKMLFLLRVPGVMKYCFMLITSRQ